MKKIFSLGLALTFVLAFPIVAKAETDPHWEARKAAREKQVNAEIARRHELNILDRKYRIALAEAGIAGGDIHINNILRNRSTSTSSATAAIVRDRRNHKSNRSGHRNRD